MHFPAMLTAVSLALLVATVVMRIARGNREPQQVFFVLSATTLAGTQIALLAMLLAHDPYIVLASVRLIVALLVLFPALAVPFFASFVREEDRKILAAPVRWVVAAAVVLAVAALVIPARLVVGKIHFDGAGSLWGMEFSVLGHAAAAYFLLANVFFLSLFENIYRAASVADKVTLKYPFLGILVASTINFVTMSRLLAISILDRNFLFAQPCAIIVLCATFLYASSRYRLFGVRVYMRPRQSPSIVSVVVAGLYLLSLGLITLLARRLGFAYDRLAVTVIGFFAAFLLLAVLISGKAKKRLRTFLSENFYLARYNYRKEWRRYAEIMTSGATVDEFLSNVISSLCDTMLVRRGAIWVDIGPGKIGCYGFDREMFDPNLIRDIQKLTTREPVIVFKKPLVGLAHDDGKWIHAVARLSPGEENRGFIILGEKDLGRAYTEEDGDFLATIAFQAKLALDNLLMEERIIEAKQMDSFNRFASFVIHDLKNTVGMLSLVAENARGNIGNTEFQQDALETIRRSVEKMQSLITSLSVHKMPASLAMRDVDLSALVERTVNDLRHTAAGGGVSLEFTGGAPARVKVDEAAVARIVDNLVLNAVEASGRGGSVRVAVETIDAAWAAITVSDSGPGFDPEYLKNHLFHPFYSTKAKGLGVGLVMCKYLSEAHGGSISIAGARGGGATVSVMLPTASPARRG